MPFTIIVGETPSLQPVDATGFAAPGSENSIGLNTSDDTAQKIFDKVEDFVVQAGANINREFRQVGYAASITEVYDPTQPNFFINLTGDLVLDVTSADNEGVFYVDLVRDPSGTGIENITLGSDPGLLSGNHAYPEGVGETIHLKGRFTTSGLVWEYYDNTVIYKDGTLTAYGLEIYSPDDVLDKAELRVVPNPDVSGRNMLEISPAETGDRVTFGNQQKVVTLDMQHVANMDDLAGATIGGMVVGKSSSNQTALYQSAGRMTINGLTAGVSVRVNGTEVADFESDGIDFKQPITLNGSPIGGTTVGFSELTQAGLWCFNSP